MENKDTIAKLVNLSVLELIETISKDAIIAPEIKEDFPENIDSRKIRNAMIIMGKYTVEPLLKALTSGSFSTSLILEIVENIDIITGKIESTNKIRVLKLQREREILNNAELEVQ